MGVSTDGQLCYGANFEEASFPWDDESKYEGDIEAWWRDVNGYKRPFELYDESGEYIDGVEPDKSKISEYYNHSSEWDKENPLPVSLVNGCSVDYPTWILAVPGTEETASRGYPQKLGDMPLDLTVPLDKLKAFIEFLEEHLEYNRENCGWWLSSYYG